MLAICLENPLLPSCLRRVKTFHTQKGFILVPPGLPPLLPTAGAPPWGCSRGVAPLAVVKNLHSDDFGFG